MELGKHQIEDDIPFMNGQADNDSLFPAESAIFESVQMPEDLPKEVHNHVLSEESLSEEICNICLKKKTCQRGYKCNLCPLIICDQCSSMIRINHFSNNKHEHPLCITNEDNCYCNNCKKQVDINDNYNNFYFNCKKCNINICLNCYYQERQSAKNEASR